MNDEEIAKKEFCNIFIKLFNLKEEQIINIVEKVSKLSRDYIENPDKDTETSIQAVMYIFSHFKGKELSMVHFYVGMMMGNFVVKSMENKTLN